MMTKTTTILFVAAAVAAVLAAWSPVAAQAPPATPGLTVTNQSPFEVLIFQVLNGALELLSTVPANAGQVVIDSFMAIDGQVDLLIQSTVMGVTEQVGRLITLSDATDILITTNSAATGLLVTITGILEGPSTVVLDLIFTNILGSLLPILVKYFLFQTLAVFSDDSCGCHESLIRVDSTFYVEQTPCQWW
ncbi:hypothetical protein Mapa_015569 [Marchantia paleacea]|nr:hypothetical protein Mapa_015569 [Marchantia paleacea]